MIKHVIVDRDGTLIRHIPYLADPQRVELLPTVQEGLRSLRDNGCRLYLHTNQSGVGRGYFTLDDAMACNEAMIALLGWDDVFADICIAPEHPHSAPVYRKPSPAWGLELMGRYGFAAGSMCYIGDALSDLLTARNLGCLGIGVNTGEHDLRAVLAADGLDTAFTVVDTFVQAAALVLASGSLAHD